MTQTGEPSRRGLRKLRNAIILGVAGVSLLIIAASRGDAGGPAQTAQQASVVVTTRALPASAVLAAPDLTVQNMPASAFDASMERAPIDVLGKRLLVPLPAHTPLERAMVDIAIAPPGGDPSRRVVRLQLPAVHVAPDVSVLGDTEVVASGDTSGGTPARKVEVVAVCKLLQLDAVAPAGATGNAGPTPGTDNVPVPDTEAVIDCAADSALRVVYAADYAHSVRLLSHPSGGTAPSVAIAASG